MKILGYNIQLFKERVPRANVELGSTGTTIFSGFISGEDYVTELTGTTALTTYDKMRKSDGVVKAALLACELPIRAANWYIEPASDDDSDKEVADFVSECLFNNMTMTWDDFLRQALLMLPFGFSVFEKVFQPVDFNGQQMIGWRKFAPRLQKTITKWKTAEGEDGITQQSFTGSSLNVSIPIEKLLIFTHQKEGDNWLGISVLRSAYRPWYFKAHIEQINAMTFERQGLGIPFAKLPKNYSENDKNKAEELLKNIRANEQSYLIQPPDWEIEFKDMKAGTLKDPDETIRRYNREILISVLAQFLDLGSGPTGSRALSADHSSTFHNNLTAVARTIKDVINKYAIKQLVDLNYSVDEYPTLEYSYIGLPRYVDVSNALGTLIDKKAITPDDKLEDYLRQLMNLPRFEITGTPTDRRPTPAVNPFVKAPEDIGDTKSQGNPKETDLGKAGSNKDEKAGKEIETQNQKKKILSEFVSWRPLTFAEKKVNFSDIRATMESETDALKSELGEIVGRSADDLIRQLQIVLEAPTSGEKRQRLQDMEVKYQGEYRKALYHSLLDNFQYGKTMAAHEMKKDVPPTPAVSLQLMSKMADNLTMIMSDDMMKAGKLALLKGLQQKQFSSLLASIMSSIKDTAKSIVLNSAILNVSDAISQGRRSSFVYYGDEIYALQRSEILDEVTCNYCISIDSRVFRKNDSFTKVDAIHSSCRGLWVEIMKDEAEKPDITGIPNSLKDAFDSTNVFNPPKHPIIKKNTPAEEYLKEAGRV